MTTSRENDHRLEARLETEQTIFIEVVASSNRAPGDVVMCNSLDVSANGLQVIVDEELAPSSIFRLCIDPKDQDPLFLVGEVKWARPDPDGGGYRLGFLLFESDDTDIQRWKEMVADMLAGKS